MENRRFRLLCFGSVGDILACSATDSFYKSCDVGLPIMLRNSRRVLASDLKSPVIRLVTMLTPVLCTPRVGIHSCDASTTTVTPLGLSTSSIVSAI